MISHDHQFIFVHIGRTGGSSLERVAGVPVTKNPATMITGNTDFLEKHKGFSHFWKKYPEECKSFFKFTIIRNPYDRLVSAWRWRRSIVKDHECSLREFLMTRNDRWGYQAQPKLEGLSFDESLAKLDFIARFETLQDDIRYIFSVVGLDYTKYPHVNQTQHRPYWEYFDKETLKLFNDKFGEDVEFFGYEFGC